MLVNILIGLLGLSVVVIVHEYGHFIFARIYKIGVEVFSVGWGGKLLGKKIGNTEYRISMIPIGGYVKLSGMNMLGSDTQPHTSDDKKDRNVLFNNAHPLQRIMVAFGGPLANIIFAFFIFMLINSFSYSQFGIPNKIVNASVLDGITYPGEQAGLENGDVIIEVNDIAVNDFRDIQNYVQRNISGRKLALTVLRKGHRHIIHIEPTASDRLIGIYPWIEPLVMDTNPDSLAEKIGIKPKDTIININDIPVRNTIEINAALQSIDKLDTISVLRYGSIVILERPSSLTTHNTVTEIGATYVSEIVRVPAKGLFANIDHSARSIIYTVTSSIRGIISLFSTEQPINNIVAGPIQITSIIGDATLNSVNIGLWGAMRSFLSLIALISIAIAIMNLLPIPILDGGQIILYLLELVVFKKLTPPIVKAYQLTGYGIILVLLGISVFSDISFILK